MSRSIIALFTGNLASKAVGVVREVAFAAWFGAGDIAAAFRIGQTGFLMPTHTLIGDSLSAGLLPLYKQYQTDETNKARLLVVIASLYGLIFSALVTTLLFLYAEAVAGFIAPGASSNALNLAADLLRIMALATPFYVLSGMLSYIEAGHGHYGAIAWRPMLLNFGSIGGAALAVWLGQSHWLATGLLISHVAFFAWTFVQLRRLDRLTPDARQSWATIRAVSGRFLRNMAPLLGLPLIAQVNVLVERIVSSWLGTEVIPSVDYARFIADTTVQLIAVPLGILTMSTRGGASAAEMRGHLQAVTGTILLLAFPTAAFIGQNAESIVRLLFARGAFDEQAVQTTTSVLRWMGGALGATVVAYYLVKALNAQLRNREALIFTVIACLANMAINLSLWPVLGTQTIGIAIAFYSTVLLALCVSALGLWRDLAPMALWIAGGVAMQLAMTALVLPALPYPLDLFVAGLIAGTLWLTLILLAPPLRRAARPVLKRLPVLRRLAD